MGRQKVGGVLPSAKSRKAINCKPSTTFLGPVKSNRFSSRSDVTTLKKLSKIHGAGSNHFDSSPTRPKRRAKDGRVVSTGWLDNVPRASAISSKPERSDTMLTSVQTFNGPRDSHQLVHTTALCNQNRFNKKRHIKSGHSQSSEVTSNRQDQPTKMESITKSSLSKASATSSRMDTDRLGKLDRKRQKSASQPRQPKGGTLVDTLHKQTPDWLHNVPRALVAASQQNQSSSTKSLVKVSSFTGPTKHIAIDCEFVGIGFEGKENALARVSIVNQFGHVLLDTLVRPKERVVDYRTKFSGIRPGDLRPGGPARPFLEVHKEVAKLCQGRILVGHSVKNDLRVLMLSHPHRALRDTSRYPPFRAMFNGRTPSLRALVDRVLGISVQTGEHDSVEDARATMRLYTSVKRVWESGKRERKVAASKSRPVKMAKFELADGQPPASRSDIISEYQTGFDSVSKPSGSVNFKNLSVSQLNKGKSRNWDASRGRYCSLKRHKFVLNRHKRARKEKLQSATL